MSVTVRRAQASDIDWLLGQLRDADAHYKRKKPLYTDRAESKLAYTMEFGVVLIAELDGAPVGFIAGVYHTEFFTDSLKQLTAVAIWTQPEERRKGVASSLITAFTREGDENADQIMVSASELSGLPSELFTDRGYLVQERAYLKEVG